MIGLWVLVEICAAKAPSYEIIDLGAGMSGAAAINDSGQVVGSSDSIGTARHAFLWDNGKITDLGTLSGGFSKANGINNAGKVVGKSGSADIGWRPFIWDRRIGMRSVGASVGGAEAINNAGQVAGGTGAFFWDPDKGLTYLGTLGGYGSYAFGINDGGQVVGRASPEHGAYHPFLWDKANGMIDLGTLGGSGGYATDINNMGQVVGWARTADGNKHAFIRGSVDGMADLGTLGGRYSEARAINDRGQVVGWAHTADSSHAFLWDRVNGMVDLTELLPAGSGWDEVSIANGINKFGQIVGQGLIEGQRCAFVMTPVSLVSYVDDSATGAGDGSSWEDAFTDLQDALAVAGTGKIIRVAQGTYKPAPQGGARKSTFQLKNGVRISGGYAGVTGDDPDDRDWVTYKTVLSGDLNGDDIKLDDPLDLPDEPTRSNNSYHVLRIEHNEGTTTLDGFIITGGIANGGHRDSWGGGLLGIEANLVVADCVFKNNWALCGAVCVTRGGTTELTDCRFTGNGGTDGAALASDCHITVTRCEFVGNVAFGQGGAIDSDATDLNLIDCSFVANKAFGTYAAGGAVYLSCDNTEQDSSITNCIFRENRVEYGGGAIFLEFSSPLITDCTFTDNSSEHQGGALNCWDSSYPAVVGCTFTSNTAQQYGGAIYGGPGISQCSFVANSAERGGAVYGGSYPLTIANCIFVRNRAEYAGAIESEGDLTLTDSLLAENTAAVWGGAIANMENTSISINCTFTGNRAKYGGAIFSNIECDTRVINSILWDNSAERGRQIYTSGSHGGSTLTVDHCDITGGRDGIHVPDGCTLLWQEGNINAEPFFVAAAEGDFHLRPISPCINAGDNSVVDPDSGDLDGNPRIMNEIVDMGAYEQAVSSRIIYVDDDAAGAADGSSWENAFVDLQSALAIAREPDEIRVARGIYRPAASGGDRSAAFEPPDGVSVIGGYAGAGEREPDIRDIRLYETILSGDLNGDDVGGLDNPSRSDNSYHVVKISRDGWRQVGTVLDGFTITGGQSDRSSDNGGGIFTLNAGFIVIRNCTVTKNYARWYGGGMWDGESYGWRLEGCVFADNFCAGGGGGLAMDGESMPIHISNCVFVNNRAGVGGGLNSVEAYTDVINCTFANNFASNVGGGIVDGGGGVDFIHCIIWGNRDSSGDGQRAQIGEPGEHTRFYNCCIAGWSGTHTGENNINVNPLFVHAAEGDLHLKSQGGRWNPHKRVWVRDESTSPCIDAGSLSAPIAREPFPNGGIINMGAYGGTSEAGKSYFGEPICETIVAGDINGDCIVNLLDLSFMARNWLQDLH